MSARSLAVFREPHLQTPGRVQLKMIDKYKLLREAIEGSIKKIDKPQLTEVDKATRGQIWRLCEEGFISLGNDHALTGFGLECRVKQVFESMKFDVTPGRDGMEDFVVPVPDGFQPSTGRPSLRLVLEVKSSRNGLTPMSCTDQRVVIRVL